MSTAGGAFDAQLRNACRMRTIGWKLAGSRPVVRLEQRDHGSARGDEAWRERSAVCRLCAWGIIKTSWRLSTGAQCHPRSSTLEPHVAYQEFGQMKPVLPRLLFRSLLAQREGGWGASWYDCGAGRCPEQGAAQSGALPGAGRCPEPTGQTTAVC
eukprot:358020-Chlamydomonas_euryale.AAC.3